MNKSEKGSSLTGGVFLAYSIIILHALIISLLVLLIIFFRSIAHHMLLVVLIGIGLTFFSGWYFFRRLKKNSQKLKDILNDPAFSGRALEITFLGGSAVFKVSAQNDQPIALGYDKTMALPYTEIASNNSVNDIQRLADLLDKGRITEEEFNRLKEKILSEE